MSTFKQGASDMSEAACKALVALHRADKIGVLPNGGAAAHQPEGWNYNLEAAALAELEERALIAFGDDRGDGIPGTLTVTAWGVSWVRRFLAGNGYHQIVLKPVPNPEGL
jgi:hypothetical protein